MPMNEVRLPSIHSTPAVLMAGVVVLEEQPFNVVRADGMPVWIYQFKISRHHSTVDAPEAPAPADRA